MNPTLGIRWNIPRPRCHKVLNRGKTEKCLVCAVPLEPNFTITKEGKLFPKTTSSLSSVRVTDFLTTEEFFLDKQLKAVFILRHILDMGNTQLSYFLSKFQGQLHPEFWIQVCKSCGEAVSSFYATLKKISSLQNKLKRISGQLKGQIYKTRNEEMGKGDGSLIWKDIRTSVLTASFFEPSPQEINGEEANHDDFDYIDNCSEPKYDEDFSGEDVDPTLHSDWEGAEEDYSNSVPNPTPPPIPSTSQLPSEKPSSTTTTTSSSPPPKKPRRRPSKYIHFCELCPAKFIELRKLKKHLHLHSILNSRRVTTCFCGWVMRANTMRLHLKQHHDGQQPQDKEEALLHPPSGTPFYCDHCQMIYTKYYHLRLHFKAFHSEKFGYLPCSQPNCEEKFESQQMLQFHLKKFHDLATNEPEEIEQDEKCPHCESVFASKLTLDFHIAKRHQESLLTCTLCNFTAKSFQHYQMHMETSKSHATTQGFFCELCGKQYWAKKGLDQHHRQEHYKELGLKPNLVSCPECGRVLKGQDSLKLHLKYVHQGAPNFSCEFCGKAFKKEKSLQIHLNSFHTGPFKSIDYPSGKHFRIENPEGDDEDEASKYYCEFCSLVFPNHKAVHRHLYADHYEALTYICEGCEQRFCTAAGLHRHRLSCPALKGPRDGEEVELDGVQEPPPKKLKLPCNFCPKGFSSQCLLTRHKKYMHKDRFDHKCEGCGKVFVNEVNLTDHLRLCKKAVANNILKIETNLRIENAT